MFRYPLTCFLLTGVLATAQETQVLPERVVLDGQGAQHRLLVERIDGAVFAGSAKGAVLRSSDPGVVRVDGDIVTAVSNGEALVTAEIGGKLVSSAKIVVQNTSDRFNWTFRNHVQSVLSKQGCNSGACHGALAGKGGFRLSLRGYNTAQDYFNITTQQLGRRVDLTEPGLSLLLTKPTTAVPHKGGKRLSEDSPDYLVITEWLADGARGPSENDPILQSLQIIPESVSLQKSQTQPLIVRAAYSDGRVEDVTSWAKFTSANEAVATVSEDGIATVIGPGEGAVSAWFGSRIVIARITSPYAQKIPPEAFVLSARRNFIDDLVMKQLRRLNLRPSPRCSDEVFIRRAFVDTVGTLPTATEVRTFLADGSAAKRDVLIEQLLDRPEIRGLLGIPLVRFTYDQWHASASGCRQVFLSVDSRSRGREYAVGPVCSRNRDRPWLEYRQRRH